MKQILFTTTLLLLFTIVSQGQEKLQLSLSEAQNYAIEHNKTIQSARLDISLSERKLKETKAQGLPQIEASLDWTTYFGYEMEFSFGTGEDVSFTNDQILDATTQTLNSFTGNPALGIIPVTPQDLYNYQAGSSFSGILQSMLPKNTIPMTDASTAKLQVGQLIFSGQYWAGIKVAELGKKIAEQGLENSILDIKESVANSYYMILITQQTIETFKKSVGSLNEIKRHTLKMFENGMAEQTDADQISIQVSMLENNLRSMDRGLQMIYSMMKFQLGLDASTEIVLSEDLDVVIGLLDPMGQIEDFNIANNSMFQLLETQEMITEKMVDMEKWSYGPTISGFYAYNQKLLTAGFDMTPNNIAGFSMSLPVFSSGVRKHKVAQAKIELDKVQLNKSMVEDQLEMQQKQLKLDLETAIENYNSQKENVELAKRVFNNTNNKYEQGMVSSLDLTQTNSNYLQAESNYIQSIMALLQAKISIDKLYNQL
ncbi:MAG: TolC family protein [Prolixibacteraceae bacterium]|jgi:outer membrane protein|nr:TolC family protein [Prolixibacteraceae bacterium]